MKRVIAGCEHTEQRMAEWAAEGACPICLTAQCGMDKETIAQLRSDLARLTREANAATDLANAACDVVQAAREAIPVLISTWHEVACPGDDESPFCQTEDGCEGNDSLRFLQDAVCVYDQRMSERDAAASPATERSDG